MECGILNETPEHSRAIQALQRCGQHVPNVVEGKERHLGDTSAWTKTLIGKQQTEAQMKCFLFHLLYDDVAEVIHT